MEPTKKVFCSKCIHFIPPDPSRCNSPLSPKKNVFNWYEEEVMGEHPWALINKHNDCKWMRLKNNSLT